MTEPESSQYHVPTQYTPRGHHRLGAPRFDVDVSDEEEDELARGSLPIASYPDHDYDVEEDEAPVPPPSSSTRQDSPLLLVPVENPGTTTLERDDGSDFGFSQVELSREALERLGHVRSRVMQRPLGSQFSVSGTAFSIPSDYYSCEES